MQQAIYNKIINEIAVSQKASGTPTMSIGKRLARRIAHQWDLWGVVALIGSCGAYALFALAHVG